MKFKMSSPATALIVAMIAFSGALIGSAWAQYTAFVVEDRRAKSELLLELMRSGDRVATLEKLDILAASGLLGDDDENLIRAVTSAPDIAFRIREVPIPTPCVDRAEIPPALPQMDTVPANAGAASGVLASRALELKAQNIELRGLLEGCLTEPTANSLAP